jgi:GNAT superfamily N-acetyltransferase
MSLSIVTTADRPDLAALTARWRWEAFFRDSGRPLDDILADAQKTAAAAQLMPRTFVLLMEGEPVGTASLVAHDLEERPDLTPWLAGVFVVPHARGRGYAARLVAAVEQAAAAAGIPMIWLYTSKAERIYAQAGWDSSRSFSITADRAPLCVVHSLAGDSRRLRRSSLPARGAGPRHAR